MNFLSAVAVFGALAAGTAILLAHSTGGALSMWFSVSAIASGGLAGLFLLAFFSHRANSRGVYTGILASVLFTAWATLTLGTKPALDLGRYNFPWHDYMIGAVAHVVLFVVGYAASLFFGDADEDSALREATLWAWLRRRRARTKPESAWN